jgi:ABC-2 type transport system ATP-binding protein
MLEGMNRRGNTVIEADGLRRRYGGDGGFEAVRGVSFDVAEGELFALLGTNGAGKTSTMEILEGLAEPTSGQVRVFGHDPYVDRATVRPGTGVMLQEGGFPSDLTVAEMADLWAGVTSNPRPTGEVLTLVDLGHRADVPIRALSGGERRRLELALAVLGRPSVLFLDEPTTGLDPESRRRTWDLIRQLVDGGTTVVLTTHYLEEAEALANRLAIMHGGRIVTSGTPAEVASSHPSTISFEPRDAVALPQLLGATVSTHANRVVLHTATLQRTLTELLSWANAQGLELTNLNARSASIEEAFLAVAATDHGISEEVLV